MGGINSKSKLGLVLRTTMERDLSRHGGKVARCPNRTALESAIMMDCLKKLAGV